MIYRPGMRTYRQIVYDERVAWASKGPVPWTLHAERGAPIVASLGSILEYGSYTFTVGVVHSAWASGDSFWTIYTMLPDWHFEGVGRIVPMLSRESQGLVTLFALGFERETAYNLGNIEAKHRIS